MQAYSSNLPWNARCHSRIRMFDRWSGSRMALVEPVLVSGWRIATRPRSLEAVFAVRVNRPLRSRDAGTANACCSRIVRGCPVSCAISRIAHERPQPSASELDDRGPRAARGAGTALYRGRVCSAPGDVERGGQIRSEEHTSELQ